MLTSKQRRFLRSKANLLEPIVHIGKGGINQNLLKQFGDALEARELVKAVVLRNSLINAVDVCKEISDAVNADVVQIIGNKFILYRESKENKEITLP